jgi:hypothetical protein
MTYYRAWISAVNNENLRRIPMTSKVLMGFTEGPQGPIYTGGR